MSPWVSFFYLLILILIPFAGPLKAQELDALPFATGAVSCASVGCHGSDSPRTETNVLQNEYTIWKSRDRHSQAFTSLLQPRSRRITGNLGIGDPERSEQCLVCHSVKAPQRGATFDPADGVGCEACHGLAGQWLGPHTRGDDRTDPRPGWGMADTESLESRARICLSCHLGEPGSEVGHRLIAAGHPALYFELESFSERMPRHWPLADEGFEGVRRWMTSQAAALAESMRQLARRAAAPPHGEWPDFADFECYSCHHDLGGPPWQLRGREDLGIPPWNASGYIVFRHAVRKFFPGEAGDFDALVRRLTEQLVQATRRRAEVVDTSRQLAELAEKWPARIENKTIGRESALDLIETIAADSRAISTSGLSSAEQATLALDALFRAAASESGAANEPLNRQIDRLYAMLQSPSGYNPVAFAQALARAGDLAR